MKRSDSCEKVQEREGICIFRARMVNAALTPSKAHPLANDRIKSLPDIAILSTDTFIETKFRCFSHSICLLIRAFTKFLISLKFLHILLSMLMIEFERLET